MSIESSKILKEKLIEAARKQNEYDLNTVNLIAPASPTPLEYFYDFPLHNAIAEGLLGKRPYAGAEAFNEIESIAVEVSKDLFNAEHANVQPHSVSQANQAAYMALLDNGERALGMEFHAGGHLTHGLKINFSGRFFDFDFYGVDEESGLIDYDSLEKKAISFQPKLIVCGASSYPRVIDFERLKYISDKIGAYLMGDLSHPAGLIVANRFPQPFPYCDVVTFTPDKTMLGPHGGIILCKKELAAQIDKAVHPGTQSSVPLQRIFHTALSLINTKSEEFYDYIDRILRNMKVFENKFNQVENLIVTGGSDTHLMVLDTYNTFDLTGAQAEELLECIGVLTNRQVIPGETLKPYVASGIRLGTSWSTARGYDENDIGVMADIILANLKNPNDSELIRISKETLGTLLEQKRKKDVWKNNKYE